MNRIPVIIFNLFLDLQFLFLLSLFFTDYSFIFGKGVTTLPGQVIIFISLLFLRWFFDKVTFSQLLVVKIYRKFSKLADREILFLIICSFILLFTWFGILNHFSFNSSGVDMGGMDNALWNAAHRNSFVSSIEGNINYFGIHFWPIAYFILPLYMLWPNVLVLIFLQAFAAGIAILPIYLIARERLNDRVLIFVFIFAYFICRSLRGIVSNDFHTDIFLIPLSLFAYYFLSKKNNLAACICFLFILLCKENAAFILAGFGFFLFFSKREYIFGLCLLVVAVAWWSTVSNIVIPYFAKSKDFWGLSWLPYGGTYGENIAVVSRNPALLVNLFFAPEKLNFYLKLFGLFGYLSLASLSHYSLFLIPLIPLVIGSASKSSMLSHAAHYQAHAIPFIIIASIYGAGNILDLMDRRLKKTSHRRHVIWLSIFIIVFALSFHGKSDGHRVVKALRSIKEREVAEVLSYLKVIPADASLSAVNRLVPHLSGRKYIYIWERRDKIPNNAQYVVLYERLMESDQDGLPLILESLRKNGYRPVISDETRRFYIYKN